MQTERIVEVRELRKRYGKENGTEALRGISFDVLAGEFLGIMGPSGSGKTTLLNCVATMTAPTGGEILVRGQNLRTLSRRDLARYRGYTIGYLFQDFELLDNLTARENISLPLALHGIAPGKAEAALMQLAETFAVAGVLDQFPSQLSGGEKQRVAACRAFITDPAILLADEPTGALDSRNAKMLLDRLFAVHQHQNRTIMMVTHDVKAASYCSRILFIQDGMIFHELRRSRQNETNAQFYERIIRVVAQLGGGSAHVL